MLMNVSDVMRRLLRDDHARCATCGRCAFARLSARVASIDRKGTIVGCSGQSSTLARRPETGWKKCSALKKIRPFANACGLGGP